MSFFFCYVSISWDALYVLPQTKQAVTQFIGRKKERKKKQSCINLFITLLQFISRVWEHKGDEKGHFSNYPERILLTAINQTEEIKTNTQ